MKFDTNIFGIAILSTVVIIIVFTLGNSFTSMVMDSKVETVPSPPPAIESSLDSFKKEIDSLKSVTILLQSEIDLLHFRDSLYQELSVATIEELLQIKYWIEFYGKE